MPASGYKIQEDYFTIVVNHAVGRFELTWGMWTVVLTGMRAYVNAYSKYDFLFEVVVFGEGQLGNRKIAARFTFMSEENED